MDSAGDPTLTWAQARGFVAWPRAFMATSRANQKAQRAARDGGTHGGKTGRKPRGRWETSAQKKRRQLRAHNAAMQQALAQFLESAPSSAVCQECAWTGGRLGRARTDHGMSLHWEQCTTCLQAMERQGWGQEDTFNDEDDAAICQLLNAHGMPCTTAGAPARRHFYRSVLHFHRRFGRTKRWRALAAYLIHNFTTSMSCPSATLPSNYRGWYRKR